MLYVRGLFVSTLCMVAANLAFFSISCGLSVEENGEGWSLRPFGDVDNLFETGYPESNVLGRHSGVVESVECHLSGGLPERLSRQRTDILTWLNLKQTTTYTYTKGFIKKLLRECIKKGVEQLNTISCK